MKYPSTLPCPLIEGYGATIEAGALRSGIELGNSRQRRRFRTMPHKISMSFMIRQIMDHGNWMAWVNAHGWNWFEIDLPGAIAGTHMEQTHPQRIRFTGPVQSDLQRIGEDYWWRVSVEAEFILAGHQQGIYNRTEDWIIARTPTNPSTDWIIARTPANPSTDWIIAPELNGL